MPWVQTTFGFQVQSSVVPVSGTDATLSGSTPFLRFTDTDTGHEDYRIYLDADILYIDWLSGVMPDAWTNVLRITDPTVAVPLLIFNKYTIKLDNLSAVAATKAIQFVVGAEANESFRVEHRGKMAWGAGGASATDVTLDRVAVGVLQTEMLRVPADPSIANDVSRKNYVDTQVALKVAKAGDTMTGLLTLSGDPTAAFHASTKQYVDARLPAGGAVAKSGDTMTGTLTFDFAVSGTIIQSKIASEANPRLKIDSAGKHEWGPGGATAPDTGIERDSAGVLRMLTGDIFAIQVGSAAAPSLAIAGDLNTGIFSIAPDILAFSTGGTEWVRINASGNVGIGVPSTSFRLNIRTPGDNSQDAISVISLDGGTIFELQTDTSGDALLNLRDSNSVLRLMFSTDSGGKIGIGTSTFTSLTNASLHILSAGNPGIKVEKSDATARKYLWYIDSNGKLTTQDDTAGAVRASFDIDGMFSLNKSLATKVLSPAQIVVTQNDYDPGKEGFWRITSDAARSITGIAGGIDGRRLVLYNLGSFTITLEHNDVGSAAANRFFFSTGADVALTAGTKIELIYDSVSSLWRDI